MQARVGLAQDVKAWIQIAVEKFDRGEFSEFDLEVLLQLVANHQPTRRALVLFALDPHLNSQVVAWSDPEMDDPTLDDLPAPYETVSAALHDGWELVSAPGQGSGRDERCEGTGLVGFEYVLQRVE